jgi:putative two-component system response regulator
MERVLLISSELEKWKDFEENLSDSFIPSKLNENIDFSDATVIAIDKIEDIEKIPEVERHRLPIIFFDDSKNISWLSKLIKTSFEYDALKSKMTSLERRMDGIQEGMAEIIAQTVESRDENTGAHIIRTATFIGLLGDEFVADGTLTSEELKLIVRAAPLHDIGKIGVRDSILLKPGMLTDDEREVMKCHSEKGAALIKKMQVRFKDHAYLQYAYDIALNHHERWDGKGYPNGKKGEEIPFCARLMSVVDVYDALVSERVYRKGMKVEKALEIIFNGRGTQFDPVVLDAFDKCKDLMVF